MSRAQFIKREYTDEMETNIINNIFNNNRNILFIKEQ